MVKDIANGVHSARHTYVRLINNAAQLLYPNSDTPRIDAEVLMQHVTEKPLAWLVSHADSLASTDHMREYHELVAKRYKGQPIAYITGVKEFWSLKLKVTPDVLIPRPDTETLVEQALILLKNKKFPKELDLGTGSGAIALAIAKERPDARVLAVDSSAAALDIARENAASVGVRNVRFQQSNWLHDIDIHNFALIASNPPYVEANDPHLSQGDLRFEPSQALIGGGDGLDDLRRITMGSLNYLKPGGTLLVEHGFNQADAVRELFQTAAYQKIEHFRDLHGLTRCTLGRLPS